MATIVYSTDLPNAAMRNTVSVVVTPASDAEAITIPLGFHPSFMHGYKLKDADETAMLYWHPGLVNFVGVVGSDFDDTTPVQASYTVATCFATVGPGPLVGDGVSKERVELGVIIYGGLVEQDVEMYLTFIA